MIWLYLQKVKCVTGIIKNVMRKCTIEPLLLQMEKRNHIYEENQTTSSIKIKESIL